MSVAKLGGGDKLDGSIEETELAMSWQLLKMDGTWGSFSTFE